MITYTEEEIRELIQTLKFFERDVYSGVLFITPEDILRGETGAAYTFITYSDDYPYVYAKILMGLLKENLNGISLIDFCDNIRSEIKLQNILVLAKILRVTEFDDIPVFLNEFPEIASWRLKIGK